MPPYIFGGHVGAGCPAEWRIGPVAGPWYCLPSAGRCGRLARPWRRTGPMNTHLPR